MGTYIRMNNRSWAGGGIILTNLLEEIAKKRCGEISNELTKEPWYTDAVDNMIAIQKKICGDGEIKTLFNKYDELCLKIHCETEERIYIQAFKDGLDVETNK